jgi:hypothetical protein
MFDETLFEFFLFLFAFAGGHGKGCTLLPEG